MLKIYGCTGCGRLQAVSRRKSVECPACRMPMEKVPLTFLQYTELSEEERTRYALRWAAARLDSRRQP